MSELIALVDGREMGVVRQQRGRITFSYTKTWREAADAYPLSLSMPLVAIQHPHAAIEPFLWGLLPDNELVLRRWAQKFQVSDRNPFALLSHVGEDCAGAVQFVRPERVEYLRTANDPEVEWLSEAEVAKRLRAVRNDASAGRAPRDTGQFSLAGAQPKTALLHDGQRWGVPSGRTPTTHILKPSTAEFDGHAENEHICLSVARALDLPTAMSEVQVFEDVTAIVVTRYDRVQASAMSKSPIRRVHQEDMCQALRVHPVNKYQNEGGPGARQIVDLLRANIMDEQDIDTFLDSLVFNWLVGGTDAHAKNYSILIGSESVVRLAPLYDIGSILAYSNIDPQKAKLAIRIGADYRLRDIGWGNWRVLAAEVGVDGDNLMSRATAMAKRLPDQLSAEIALARTAGLSHPIIDVLAKAIGERAITLGKTSPRPSG